MTAALPVFENLGYGAQIKKNGTCSVLQYDPVTGHLDTWTRHNEPHKLWTANLASPALRKFTELKGRDFQVVGELLHSKVQGIKDTLYLFDILRCDGEDLVGTTYAERLSLLHTLWEPTSKGAQFDTVDERLWIANIYMRDFQSEFAKLTAPEDEGLVLKDMNAKLVPCWRQTANAGWQVKCRRPTKNYGH
jgi:hypothetical protein